MDARQYSADETLLDGRRVHLRAIRPDDKQSLQEGFRRLSGRSVYFRFFRPKRALSEAELKYFTEIDFVRHVALLAVLREDDGEQPIGVGRYIEMNDAGPYRRAEVAFAVDESHHGLGVATLLLRHLVVIARAHGIATFEADVLADNEKMLEVFAHSGLPLHRKIIGFVLLVLIGGIPSVVFLGTLKGVAGLFATHPPLEERIRRVEKMMA